jgi:hypothetical protein
LISASVANAGAGPLPVLNTLVFACIPMAVVSGAKRPVTIGDG